MCVCVCVLAYVRVFPLITTQDLGVPELEFASFKSLNVT